MSGRPPRLLRGLRRRLSASLAAQDELDAVRAELAAVRAAYARDAALFIAHRAEWDRERAELLDRVELASGIGRLVGAADGLSAAVRARFSHLQSD